jgi:hypothetical protein
MELADILEHCAAHEARACRLRELSAPEHADA